MIKDERKKKKRRKTGLIVFLSILLLIGLSVLIVWKVFTVKTVQVDGNVLYDDEQIKKFVLDDKYAWNTLYDVFKYRFLKTKEIPFVDTMEVTLKNPHTLNIQVYEKGIIGYLYISSIDRNAYFDKDGFVVETSKKVIDGVPQIKGLDCGKVVLYEKLDVKSNSVLKTLLTLTQTLKKYKILPATIEFTGDEDATLNYTNGIDVKLGNEDNLTEKILRVSVILPQLEGMTGILHVENWTENTTDIIFDKKSQ